MTALITQMIYFILGSLRKMGGGNFQQVDSGLLCRLL